MSDIVKITTRGWDSVKDSGKREEFKTGSKRDSRNGKGIVQAYLSANLIKDVNIGRVDMVNAIMAQILVFDDHLVPVINRVNANGARAKQIFANLSADQLNEVRAMIYNGGPSKYNISTGGLNLKARGAKETLGFIQKLRVIRDLKLFK